MGRLVGCIRTEEVLGTAVAQVKLVRARRLSRPDSEARLGRAGIARQIDRAGRIDMNQRYVGRARRELRLRQGVDLRAGKAVMQPRVCVGRNVESIRIGADVWIVPEVRASIHSARVRPIVGHVDFVDVPAACWVRCLTDRDVEMVHERPPAIWQSIECEDNDKEALRRRVVETARVGEACATSAGRAVDRSLVAEERVQVHGMFHIAWKAADDVGRGVVGQHRLT